MAVTYKIATKRPGGMAGVNAPKYYPVLTDSKMMDSRAVSKLLSERSGIHMGSVLAVMEALVQTVPKLLMEGYSVKLNDFGTFSLHVSASGQDEARKVRPADIKNIKMAFLPSKLVKSRLEKTKFRKKK